MYSLFPSAYTNPSFPYKAACQIRMPPADGKFSRFEAFRWCRRTRRPEASPCHEIRCNAPMRTDNRKPPAQTSRRNHPLTSSKSAQSFTGYFSYLPNGGLGIFLRNTVKPFDKCFDSGRECPEIQWRSKYDAIRRLDFGTSSLKASF